MQTRGQHRLTSDYLLSTCVVYLRQGKGRSGAFSPTGRTLANFRFPNAVLAILTNVFQAEKTGRRQKLCTVTPEDSPAREAV